MIDAQATQTFVKEEPPQLKLHPTNTPISLKRLLDEWKAHATSWSEDDAFTIKVQILNLLRGRTDSATLSDAALYAKMGITDDFFKDYHFVMRPGKDERNEFVSVACISDGRFLWHSFRISIVRDYHSKQPKLCRTMDESHRTIASFKILEGWPTLFEGFSGVHERNGITWTHLQNVRDSVFAYAGMVPAVVVIDAVIASVQACTNNGNGFKFLYGFSQTEHGIKFVLHVDREEKDGGELFTCHHRFTLRKKKDQ